MQIIYSLHYIQNNHSHQDPDYFLVCRLFTTFIIFKIIIHTKIKIIFWCADYLQPSLYSKQNNYSHQDPDYFLVCRLFTTFIIFKIIIHIKIKIIFWCADYLQPSQREICGFAVGNVFTASTCHKWELSKQSICFPKLPSSSSSSS